MPYIMLTSIDVDEAHRVLDRLDGYGITDLVPASDTEDSVAVAMVEQLRVEAINWAFGNSVRSAAVDEIARLVGALRDKRLDTNISALAQMTGVSRQTLHARLRERDVAG
jgi:transcriptional regulator of acetoin/glycerol metabolism